MCFDSSFASGKFFQMWQLPPIALWWPATAGEKVFIGNSSPLNSAVIIRELEHSDNHSISITLFLSSQKQFSKIKIF
jgi:hypothetical protein